MAGGSRATLGGSPAESGKPRYICGISAPAAVPVFLTVNVTLRPETERAE